MLNNSKYLKYKHQLADSLKSCKLKLVDKVSLTIEFAFNNVSVSPEVGR